MDMVLDVWRLALIWSSVDLALCIGLDCRRGDVVPIVVGIGIVSSSLSSMRRCFSRQRCCRHERNDDDAGNRAVYTATFGCSWARQGDALAASIIVYVCDLW